MPVHEYTLQGENRLELVIFPRPAVEPAALAPPRQRLVASGKEHAHLSILLPRADNPVDEGSARSLGQVDWTPAADIPFLAPLQLTQDVTLRSASRAGAGSMPRPSPRRCRPRSRPRRWPSSAAWPKTSAAARRTPFMNACRLRSEELATAYQRDPESERTRLREALLEGYASQSLQWPAPEAEGLALRPLAGGRLLEALGPDGSPALQSAPDADGKRWALPLRLAFVENRFYVLR